MRFEKLIGVMALLAATASAQAPPRPQQSPPPPPAPLAVSQQGSTAVAQNPPASAPPIKTSTRLITVDVVVSDSHGNAVRGLQQDDFQVFDEHSGQQKLVHFEFVDTLANARTAGAAPAKLPPYMFSNVRSGPMTLPPTVILMDALNTDVFKQLQVRQDMLLFVKRLPPDTPVAVFLLGRSLRMVQNFTTDPSLLLAAVNRSGLASASGVRPMPQDDPDNASNTALNFGTNTPESMIESLEDFEKQEYEMLMDQRVRQTADAMNAIAKFLRGYSGRKNLIWFSESFPIWIEPTVDFGSDPFLGSTSYAGKVREAAYALTDARVAVYPVDARALEDSDAFSASNSYNRATASGTGFAGAMSRDDMLRINSQATMDEVAEASGGRTCKNTNDLAGCVKKALDQSSSYYEIAYYPENSKWDGSFHRITVKTQQKGVKLAYRRGYFATDLSALARKTSPDDLLKQSCSDALPATSIAIVAQAVAPDKSSKQPGQARYILNIPIGDLSLDSPGGAHSLNARLAICEYTPKGDAFHLLTRDLSRGVPQPVYESWKSHGMRDLFDYQAKAENQRLRFTVLDVPSGQTGAIDVPAHPERYGALPAPIVSADASSASSMPAPTAKPPTPAPASTAGFAAPPPTHIMFRASTGASSMLDWDGDDVTYHGDLTTGPGARALFGQIFGRIYRCDTGKLVPIDVTSTANPDLVITLRKPGHTGAQIDLGGSAPAYAGDVPVDSSGRAFFEDLWKLCHCEQP
jgi:VWFA-related protein